MAANGEEDFEHVQNTGDKFIVKYRHESYDITEFVRKHPGGISTLKGLEHADMTKRFMKAPPHSDAAMYLMKEYKVETDSDSMTRKTMVTEKLTKESGIEVINDEDKINNNQLDESLEHLVDWSVAMLPQISKISKYYDEWVHKPVDRPLRLFGPWYLEMLTKTPWWIIPTFWVPVILKCIMNEFQSSWETANTAKFTFLAFYFLIGILFWTLLEYTLHRWVFHMNVSNSSPLVCTMHFMIHGLHHKVPFDSMRLVFPPVPGVILASAIYTPLSFLVPYPRILLGGALFGYLCYDLMHYYLHYGNPSLKHLYHMKRYHYQHHFAHQDMGYGISSPLWDVVFSTRIHLRKLKYRLRWK